MVRPLVLWAWRVLLRSPSSNDNRILRRKFVDMTCIPTDMNMTTCRLQRQKLCFHADRGQKLMRMCTVFLWCSDLLSLPTIKIASRMFGSLSRWCQQHCWNFPETDNGLSEQLVHHTLHLRTKVYTQSTVLTDTVQTLNSDTTPIPGHRARCEHKFTPIRCSCGLVFGTLGLIGLSSKEAINADQQMLRPQKNNQKRRTINHKHQLRRNIERKHLNQNGPSADA